MKNNPNIEKRYIDETNWESIDYDRACTELWSWYHNPAEVIQELLDEVALTGNHVNVRTPYAYYRIAKESQP